MDARDTAASTDAIKPMREGTPTQAEPNHQAPSRPVEKKKNDHIQQQKIQAQQCEAAQSRRFHPSPRQELCRPYLAGLCRNKVCTLMHPTDEQLPRARQLLSHANLTPQGTTGLSEVDALV